LKKLVLAMLAAVAGVVVAFATAGGAANIHAAAQAVCPGPPFETAGCHALVAVDAHGNPDATTSPTGYGPSQFHTAYALPTTSAASAVQTIAIVDAYDDPTIRSDLTTYDRTYNVPDLPTCTSPTQVAACFVKVNQYGQTSSLPVKSSGWALEISLDVEIAHAICQNCKILLVEASSASYSNLATAVNRAALLGANAISNSYGGSESSGETSYDGYYRHPGIAVLASSGDSGYGVQYPAASQYVVGVGGTTLKLTSTNTRYSETAWSGAGSGCSAFEPKPSWQTAVTQCSRKAIADVSADADPSTGASVYDSTSYQGQVGWFRVGGTSLASPLVAAAYALSGRYTTSTSQYAGAVPWSSASSLYDVKSGANGACSPALWCTATTGWDGPTGLGAPKGTDGF
jgi:subtilase family serine protease